MKPRYLLVGFLGLAGCNGLGSAHAVEAAQPTRADKVVKSDAEWKRTLSPLAYDVLRHQGTEVAFTGPYWNDHRKAIYHCAGCNLVVFKSDDKFDSGTGWPSFTRPAAPDAVAVQKDDSHGMERNEVHCPRCGGHLGHVFDDGPRPTGQRYCINSCALELDAPAG
jgi:peptide-methionine (R)-S-oxide reductase